MIESLPRRERDVFETLCRLGEGSTANVRQALDAELSDSAVRTLLSRLETKGLIVRGGDEGAVVYRPRPKVDAVARGALQRMVDTFFAGSAASAATALLGLAGPLDPDEAAALERVIDQARERGK